MVVRVVILSVEKRVKVEVLRVGENFLNYGPERGPSNPMSNH
jgi:hypothetical protein